MTSSLASLSSRCGTREQRPGYLARATNSAWTCGGVSAILLVAACGEPTVVMGARVCPQSPQDSGATEDFDASIEMPWSTGFEDGFCDYALPVGYCYPLSGGTYSLVTSPVHSGHYAAAFTSNGDAGAVSQARCVEQGIFPTAAYYGAWYFIPVSAEVDAGNLNLWHFQGAPSGQSIHYVWDVSLANQSDGGLQVFFLNSLADAATPASAVPAVPIGRWFHLEVYFKRAKDDGGVISIWQDDQLAVHLTGLVTDDTDWGQWYVGNLAKGLSPPNLTVYVDDVTIDSSQ